MANVTRTPIDAATAVRFEHGKPYDWKRQSKILVSLGGARETMRWGKVVHIECIKRVPTIHADGRVTVRDRGDDMPVRAERLAMEVPANDKHGACTRIWHSFAIDYGTVEL